MARRPAPYMTLAAANFFLKYAKARGVSKVARGESSSKVTREGFMQAYARVKGDPKKLTTRMATPTQSWAERRDNFVGRHMAQMTLHGEKLWETTGKYKGQPTRRHLGLIMWAMTPDPNGVGRFIAKARGVKVPTTRRNGKAIVIPVSWRLGAEDVVDRAKAAFKGQAVGEGEIVEIKGKPAYVETLRLPLDLAELPTSLAATSAMGTAEVTVVVTAGRTVKRGTPGMYVPDHNIIFLAAGASKSTLAGTINHELLHFIQYLPAQAAERWPGIRLTPPQFGLRRGTTAARASGLTGGETYEFEAYARTVLDTARQMISKEYERAFISRRKYDWPDFARSAEVRQGALRGYVEHVLRPYAAQIVDPKARSAFRRKVAASIEPEFRDLELVFADPIAQRTRANSRATTAKRDDPDLWEEVKAEVTRGTKGGKAGQWSARKAQMAVALYQQRGGGYIGPKSPKNALAKWTREEWGTRSGKASLVTGERYLPRAAREALTPAEYAETTRAKRAGLRRGEQFTPQPGRIAKKTAKYRK